MAIIVEDGTGLVAAESYVSVADLKVYADGRGLVYAGSADSVLEQKLREATGYIDSEFRFKAARLLAAQALEFPRDGLVDWSGHDVTGVPKRVKDACCELAIKAIAGPLFSDADRGGMVKSESVGPISVTYADGAPAEKLYTAAARTLQQYVRSSRDTGSPVFGGSEVGYVSLGVHDNPEAAGEA
jgi:hypothetical protein